MTSIRLENIDYAILVIYFGFGLVMLILSKRGGKDEV